MLTKDQKAWALALLLIERARDRDLLRRNADPYPVAAVAPKRRKKVRKLLAFLVTLLSFQYVVACCPAAALGDDTPGPDPGDHDYIIFASVSASL